MPFYLSPSVNVQERDYTLIIPQVATSIGATVGNFRWGAVNDAVLISSVDELIKVFGAADDLNAKDWFTVFNFLQYSSAIQVARTINDDFKQAQITTTANNVVSLLSTEIPGSGGGRTNADYTVYNITQGTVLAGTLFTLNADDLTVTAPAGEIASGDVVVVEWLANGETVAHNARDVSTPVWDIVKQIKNETHYSILEDTLNADNRRTLANVFAKYPGLYGNRISVAWRDGKTHGTDTWEDWTYASQFEYKPIQDASHDEIGIVVFLDGNIVERFLVDMVQGRKDGDNVSNYYLDVINNNSSYIWGTTNLVDGFVANSSDLYSSVTYTASGTNTASAVTTDAFDVKNSAGTTLADGANFANYVSVRAYVDNVEFTEANFPGATVTFSNNSGDLQVVLTKTAAFAGTESIVVVAQDSTEYGALIQLGGGTDGDAAVAGDYITVWNDQFSNSEDLDINLCMQGGADDTVGRHIIQNIAEYRKDCVAFVSPQQTTVVHVPDAVGNLIAWRGGTGAYTVNHMNVSSSYGFADANYKFQYDPYNEKNRWVPLNGDIAGLAARTDATNDSWWSFAGYNRGQIKNVVKLAISTDRTDRDALYPVNLNPVVSEPAEGTILLGDKTLLARPSAFNRVNVRRLFIVLEKAISTAAKYDLFEFNDPVTRQLFVQMVTPFLRTVQGRRGIQADEPGRPGFLVIADERVNTPQVVDAAEFKANIHIRPNRAINFIELTFTAVGTGVSFDEVNVAV